MSNCVLKKVVLAVGVVILLLGGSTLSVVGRPRAGLNIPAHSRVTTDDLDQLPAANNEGFTLFFPIIAAEFPLAMAPSGVQYYGLVGPTTGFDHFVATRAGWVRVPVNWSSIEPVNTEPANFRWSSTLDATALNATRAGKQIILTLGGQPSWAAKYPMGPPYDNADLLEFVSALVERYDGDGAADAPGSPVIQYYELYNEPDNTDPLRAAHGGWGYWGDNGAAYAELMKAVYRVIKAASPEAQLVFGGIAHDWFVDDGGIFSRAFLDDVLRACQGYDCFDYANFHYYPVFHGAWDPNGPGILGKATYLRGKLAEYGMGHLPMVASELGWVSSEASWGKSEDLQARYAVQGFVRGFAADLHAMIWFKADDRGMTENPGLLDEDLQPKPAYEAFKTTSQVLADATFDRALTSAEKDGCTLEGYVLRKESQRVDVVWTVDGTPLDASDDPICAYKVRALSVRVIDKLGNTVTHVDGDDGQNDGWVTISVDGSPLFVKYD